jgi:hypothetical protein
MDDDDRDLILLEELRHQRASSKALTEQLKRIENTLSWFLGNSR